MGEAVIRKTNAVLNGINNRSRAAEMTNVAWAESESHKLLVIEGQRLNGLQPRRPPAGRGTSALSRSTYYTTTFMGQRYYLPSQH